MNDPLPPHQAPPPASPEPLVIRMPIDVRSVSLAVLATIAVIFVLHWAKAVLIPVTLAIFISYTMLPVVTWLEGRLKLPVALSAAVALAILVLVTAFGIAALRPQALEFLDILPQAAKKVDSAIRRHMRDSGSAVQKVQSAAAEIEKAAKSATGAPQGSDVKPAPSQPPIKVGDYVWIGTVGAMVGAGQALMVIALAYFLLVSGHSFKRKLVRISGETLSSKKVTVQILAEVDHQIQRYLLVHVTTSALYGAAMWGALEAVGLQNAPFWAVVAAVLHLIPYLGVVIVTVATGLVAFLQFDELWRVGAVVATSLTLSAIVGLLIFPWFTERVGRISAVTTFVALLFWGWLWGVWGLLLGVPIVMALNAVCERVSGLRPIAEMLSAEPPKQARHEHPQVAGGAEQPP